MNYNLDVVIPFYNEIHLISRAVNSIVINCSSLPSLTYRILIGNDGDIPNSKIYDAIELQDRKFVTIIKNKFAKGPGGARNTCLDVCESEFIAFLDADDYWLPRKLIPQLELVRSGSTFVTTSYSFDSNNVVVAPPSSIKTPVDIFRRRGIGTSTVLITRKLLGNIRFKDLRFSQDIDFWYALAQTASFRYAAVTEPLVVYSTNGSTKNKIQQLRSLIHVLRINNINQYDKFRVLLSYSFSGIVNHYLK